MRHSIRLLCPSLQHHETHNDFCVPPGETFQRSNQNSSKAGQSDLMTQRGSQHGFFRRRPGSRRSIESHQVFSKAPGGADTFIAWKKMRQNLPHLVGSIQSRGALARRQFCTNVDQELFLLDHGICKKTGIALIRNRVTIVLHG